MILCLFRRKVRKSIKDRHPELRAAQRSAVEDLFLSREKIVGLDGVAGAGKTTVLSVIGEGAVADGYRVEGFAPTSRAAQKLTEAGMETSTLQKHLARGMPPDAGRVLIHVDTELGAKGLLNSRMAYVAVSRGAHDAQIFTNSAAALGHALSRDVSHAPAIQQAPISHAIEQNAEQVAAHTREIGHGFGLGM
jgi:ATPase subunit of ABC transporter with duplicated ATPase domains